MELLAEAVRMFMNGNEILKGLDFHLQGREFVGIIGPNGSGKSTFLKCLYRVQKPDKGEIYLNKNRLEEFSYRESAQQIAVVAQHNFYNFDFTVMEMVLMGRAPYKKVLERDKDEELLLAKEALYKVGLKGMETRSFQTLSGGEQQRVMMARALVQQTNCLILDEPTNHLDIKYQLEIMDIAKSLHVSVIAAIHDLNIAAMYCDRLIALKEGRIVGEGKPQSLLTEDFIREVYEVECQVIRAKDGGINIVYLPQHRKNV